MRDDLVRQGTALAVPKQQRESGGFEPLGATGFHAVILEAIRRGWPKDLRFKYLPRVANTQPGAEGSNRSGGLTQKERHIVALDIGSTKTCALIGEQDDGGIALKFAALGAAESKGWRKGQIVNLDLAVSSIRRAVEEAEGITGVPVESAMIGVAGGHVRGVNSRGGITIGARPRDVHRDDVRRAIEAARGVTLPEDREVLHVLPQEFFLDGQSNIRDAIGMVGQRLEANVHIVTASGTTTQNIVTAVNRAGVRVDDTVLEPLASAEACLTQDERELGACLLDIGGGTTEMIGYTGGVVRHTAAVPVGGDHFTKRSGRWPAHANP